MSQVIRLPTEGTRALLMKYEAARSALEAAHQIDEVKLIHDKAVALAAYARQAKDHDMVNWAMEIRVRAERRAGELLTAMPKNGGAKGIGKSVLDTDEGTHTLSDLGITYDNSSRWQKLASIPEPEFEARVAERKARGAPLSTRALLAAQKMATRTVAPVVPISDEAMREAGRLIADYVAEEAALDRTVAELGDRLQPSPETRAAEAVAGEVLSQLRRVHALLRSANPKPQFNHRWLEAARLASSILKQVEALT